MPFTCKMAKTFCLILMLCINEWGDNSSNNLAGENIY